MKRKLIGFISVMLIMLFSMQTVLAGWTTQVSSDRYASYRKVVKHTNSLGQRCYRMYDNEDNLLVEIFARNGNIWNNTTQALLTDKNKDAKSLIITSDLKVFGINIHKELTRFERDFKSGDTPQILEGYGDAIDFKRDENGVGIGVYMDRGLYSIAEERIIEDASDIYDDSNSIYDFDDENYEGEDWIDAYTLKNGTLRYKNTTISANVTKVKIAGYRKNYMVYVTESKNCYQVKKGSTQTTFICSNFKKFLWDEEEEYVEAVSDGKKTYPIGDSRYEDDDTIVDSYPYVVEIQKHDDAYYWYHKRENKVYAYCLTEDGDVSYLGEYKTSSDSAYNKSGTFINDDVEQVYFAEDYLLYIKVRNSNRLKDTLDCYLVPIGSKKYEKQYKNFEEFIYDEDTGLAIGVETSSGEHYF